MGTADGVWLFFFLCLTSHTRTPTRWKSVECRTIRYRHHHHHPPHHHNNKRIISVWCLPRLKRAEIRKGVSAKQRSSSYRSIFCLWPSWGDLLCEERQYSHQFFSFGFLKVLTYLAECLKKRIRNQPPSRFLTRIHMIHDFQTTHPAGIFFFSSDPLRPIYFPKYTQLICNRKCWIFMRKT